jgi:hypothetical protein
MKMIVDTQTVRQVTFLAFPSALANASRRLHRADPHRRQLTFQRQAFWSDGCGHGYLEVVRPVVEEGEAYRGLK